MPTNDKRKKKSRLYKVLAKYHGYMGLAFGILIISAGITGIFLNHEDFILGLFEPDIAEEQAEEDETEADEPEDTSLLETSGLPETKVTFVEALSVASETFGEDVPLEKIELKDEGGRLIYKVKTNKHLVKERELIINAYTGEATHRDKGEYFLNRVNASGEDEFAGIEWGELLLDIHTGEFFGGFRGQLLIDVAALAMIFLTGSGIYIWIKPRRKRKARASKVRSQAAAGESRQARKAPTEKEQLATADSDR